MEIWLNKSYFIHEIALPFIYMQMYYWEEKVSLKQYTYIKQYINSFIW